MSTRNHDSHVCMTSRKYASFPIMSERKQTDTNRASPVMDGQTTGTVDRHSSYFAIAYRLGNYAISQVFQYSTSTVMYLLDLSYCTSTSYATDTALTVSPDYTVFVCLFSRNAYDTVIIEYCSCTSQYLEHRSYWYEVVTLSIVLQGSVQSQSYEVRILFGFNSNPSPMSMTYDWY